MEETHRKHRETQRGHRGDKERTQQKDTEETQRKDKANTEEAKRRHREGTPKTQRAQQEKHKHRTRKHHRQEANPKRQRGTRDWQKGKRKAPRKVRPKTTVFQCLWQWGQIRGSIVVSISARHAEDPGSIPVRRVLFLICGKL